MNEHMVRDHLSRYHGWTMPADMAQRQLDIEHDHIHDADGEAPVPHGHPVCRVDGCAGRMYPLGVPWSQPWACDLDPDHVEHAPSCPSWRTTDPRTSCACGRTITNPRST